MLPAIQTTVDHSLGAVFSADSSAPLPSSQETLPTKTEVDSITHAPERSPSVSQETVTTQTEKQQSFETPSITDQPAPVPAMSQAEPAPSTEKQDATGLDMDPRTWHTSFYDCMSPCHLCLTAFWCPCVVYGRNVTRMQNPADPDDFPINVPCFFYYFLGCFGLQCCLGAFTRIQHRSQMGVEGDALEDFCAHFCCTTCALTQESKEIDHRYPQLRE